MSKNKSHEKLLSQLAPLGLLLIAAATVVPIFTGLRSDLVWYKYLYAAGALWLLVCRLFTPFRGEDTRLRRLHRIESWSAIFFCVGAGFMFWPGAAMRDWLAFTLAGAAIQIYTSIAIPARMAKLVRQKADKK